ncbi:MAG TPA: hypothetical protein VEA44_00160 [Caulobacter sp.]|nr:hypothetical protein [Caulobacter sp.]
MSGFGSFFKALGANPVLDAEVRAEAWALGGRHAGEVLAGAQSELAAGGLTPKRAMLLRAVIRSRVAHP